MQRVHHRQFECGTGFRELVAEAFDLADVAGCDRVPRVVGRRLHPLTLGAFRCAGIHARQHGLGGRICNARKHRFRPVEFRLVAAADRGLGALDGVLDVVDLVGDLVDVLCGRRAMARPFAKAGPRARDPGPRFGQFPFIKQGARLGERIADTGDAGNCVLRRLDHEQLVGRAPRGELVPHARHPADIAGRDRFLGAFGGADDRR